MEPLSPPIPKNLYSILFWPSLLRDEFFYCITNIYCQIHLMTDPSHTWAFFYQTTMYTLKTLNFSPHIILVLKQCPLEVSNFSKKLFSLYLRQTQETLWPACPCWWHPPSQWVWILFRNTISQLNIWWYYISFKKFGMSLFWKHFLKTWLIVKLFTVLPQVNGVLFKLINHCPI